VSGGCLTPDVAGKPDPSIHSERPCQERNHGPHDMGFVVRASFTRIWWGGLGRYEHAETGTIKALSHIPTPGLRSTMSNENGFCKHCGADFDGGNILDVFIKRGKTVSELEEIAEMYGYGPGRTQWGRQIGIYCMERDRTVNTQCPDCKEIQ